jgi:hypothetical protein
LIKRNFRIERGNCVCEDDDDELVRQRRVGRECLFLDFLRKNRMKHEVFKDIVVVLAENENESGKERLGVRERKWKAMVCFLAYCFRK